ncbi:outer membrane biogenesis protein BamB [Caulifigura coniformis]|uniref:Outer membrane biogenesis protein BamB n=1 Tax=Caulifigura coniformis TaxID=2527983 RepID=A0A517S888_9PLAN|nr:PQQ-binding-like beta-propeller repeat protein [Caulifigura coniformis]QDT52330.1 outer membrane biogenesis protein BamB [Caulifigura coniformis]
MRFVTSLLCGLVIFAPSASADEFSEKKSKNWHQWRGPLATGVAPEADPPTEWSATKNVKWVARIPGFGKSSPIVWDDRVFLTSAIDTGEVVPGATKPEDQPERRFDIKFPHTKYRFVVDCLDRNTGKFLWQQTAVEELPHEGHHGDNSHASASATTDGKRLYVSFGSRGMYCYDLDGKKLWEHKLPNVETRLSFGEGSSPVVHGDTVILVRDNETASTILALDAATGETRWQKPRDETSAWATPLIVEAAGKTQVVTNSSNRVRSYDLKTGDVIWECGGQVSNVTPSPVPVGNDVICMSGYRGSVAMRLPLDATGDITGTSKIVWKYDQDTPYVPSPLLVDGRLFFNKLNNAILTVLDSETGKVVRGPERMQGLKSLYASPVSAAGRVYFTSREGTTVVYKLGDDLEVLSTNTVEDLVDASAAPVGKQLFLRGKDVLYCFENGGS